MQLQFPKITWNQRWRFTKTELLHISDNSTSINFNEEKWNQNKEFYYIQEYQCTTQELLGEEINYALNIQDKDLKKPEKAKWIYVSTKYEIISSLGKHKYAEALIESCDIHCAVCYSKDTEKDCHDHVVNLVAFDLGDNMERTEVFCQKCLNQIMKKIDKKLKNSKRWGLYIFNMTIPERDLFLLEFIKIKQKENTKKAA